MSTYREAIFHARTGETIRLGSKEIRYLTFDEAEPIILGQCPSRATRLDNDLESPRYGKPLIVNGQIVVDVYADPMMDLKRFGLFDVGAHPAEPFSPTDDDIYAPAEPDENGAEQPRALRTDWVRVGIDDVAVEDEMPAAEERAPE